MSFRNYNRKTISIICLFLLTIVIVFFLIGINFFNPTLTLTTMIPLIIIIVIAIIAIRFSWQPQKYCPRCNVPISVYSEYCRNCGLKLIRRCPNCNKYLKMTTSYCDNCGYKFDLLEKLEEKKDFEIIKKGSPAPEKANFCPTCGANLKDAENFRFCEYCGAKLT